MAVIWFVQYLREQRLVIDYLSIFAASISIYDYFLTLHLEIKLIWPSPWTYTKVLFLLIRYMTFFTVLFALNNQMLPNRSVNSCMVTLSAEAWLLIGVIILSQVIVAIRTWAVWQRSRAVGTGLLVLTITHLLLQCILMNRYVHSMEHASPPYPGFRGCYITNVNGKLWPNYTVLAIVEAIVLILMLINGIRTYKTGYNSSILNTIHRDSGLFYVYLFCISAANLALTMAVPLVQSALLTFMQDILYPVFTARIILNIRHVSSPSLQTELHTISYPGNLSFAPHFSSPTVHEKQPSRDCAHLSRFSTISKDTDFGNSFYSTV